MILFSPFKAAGLFDSIPVRYATARLTVIKTRLFMTYHSGCGLVNIPPWYMTACSAKQIPQITRPTTAKEAIIAAFCRKNGTDELCILRRISLFLNSMITMLMDMIVAPKKAYGI